MIWIRTGVHQPHLKGREKQVVVARTSGITMVLALLWLVLVGR